MRRGAVVVESGGPRTATRGGNAGRVVISGTTTGANENAGGPASASRSGAASWKLEGLAGTTRLLQPAHSGPETTGSCPFVLGSGSAQQCMPAQSAEASDAPRPSGHRHRLVRMPQGSRNPGSMSRTRTKDAIRIDREPVYRPASALTCRHPQPAATSRPPRSCASASPHSAGARCRRRCCRACASPGSSPYGSR